MIDDFSPSFKNYFAYCIMVYIIAIIQIVLFYGSDVFVHVCVYCVCEYVCAVYHEHIKPL